MSLVEERSKHPVEVRLAMLESYEERSLEHYRKLDRTISDGLNKIYVKMDATNEKLLTLHCNVHDERIKSVNAHLAWMWGVLAIVLGGMVTISFKIILGG